MRAILRASDQSSLLWIDSGERFELPELTDPEVTARRQAAARKGLEPTGPTDEGGPGPSLGPGLLPAESRATSADGERRSLIVGESGSRSDRRPGPGAAARLPAPSGRAVRDRAPGAAGRVAPSGRTAAAARPASTRAEPPRSRPTPPRPKDEEAVEDLVTDESPRSPLRLLRPSPVAPVGGIAPDSLPPLGALERERAELEHRLPAGVPRQFARLDDEMSTGLFEPLAWDEADPCSVPEVVAAGEITGASRSPARQPSPPPPEPLPAPVRAVGAAPAPRASERAGRPHLSVVRRAEIDEDFSGIVATPLSPPPRPSAAECVLPAPRRAARRPDWWDEEANGTRIVLDPTRPARRWGFWTCVAVDLLAWAAGFVVTFAVGAVLSATAVGVAVSLG